MATVNAPSHRYKFYGWAINLRLASCDAYQIVHLLPHIASPHEVRRGHVTGAGQ